MEEAFLHFIWLHGLFDTNNLKLTNGSTLVITRRGVLNSDSGPDFFNARIKIDDSEWVGNIEIHKKASDWDKHKHTSDAAYNNTILHVVYEADKEVYLQEGSMLPCLILKGRINEALHEHYQELSSTLDAIPCSRLNPIKYESEVLQMQHRALAERMILKAERVIILADELKYDWQSVFYILLARYLGMKVNSDAMEQLARFTPNLLLAKNKENSQKVESLLFGQAGMLQGKSLDNYHRELKNEYTFLAAKYSLKPMNATAWKFMRMRPANFPTLRISQLGDLIVKSSHLFSQIIEVKNSIQLAQLFEAKASDYWNTHYRFGIVSSNSQKTLGADTRDGLLINTVAPILFAYGHYHANDEMKEKAFDLLAVVKPENNKITRTMISLGFRNTTSYESQAFLGLRELYCTKKRCLECAVGMKIIRGEGKLKTADNLGEN
jgi:hypothetical protein